MVPLPAVTKLTHYTTFKLALDHPFSHVMQNFNTRPGGSACDSSSVTVIPRLAVSMNVSPITDVIAIKVLPPRLLLPLLARLLSPTSAPYPIVPPPPTPNLCP